MQFRKSISQTAECLMKYMKSRRVRDFVTDQRVVEESEICNRLESCDEVCGIGHRNAFSDDHDEFDAGFDGFDHEHL